MTRAMSLRLLAATAALAAAVSLTGCGSAPATAEQRRLEESRLLAPFLGDVEVGCSELVVECTGNFHVNVGQPAVDATAHNVRREEGKGYVDTIWTNTTGMGRTALNVVIGEAAEFTERGLHRGPQTRFSVMNQFRLRVWRDRRPLTLSATASGPVVLVREGGSQVRETRGYVVDDGVARQQ
ncbi:MAG: hypothetical protein RL398_2425 [Planctomycetota bacterium]